MQVIDNHIEGYDGPELRANISVSLPISVLIKLDKERKFVTRGKAVRTIIEYAISQEGFIATMVGMKDVPPSPKPTDLL